MSVIQTFNSEIADEVAAILADLPADQPSRTGETNVVVLSRPLPASDHLEPHWADDEFCLLWAATMGALLGDEPDEVFTEEQWIALADASERVALGGYRVIEFVG
jgi:hypothetical protein